jgi:dihydrofolate reductase
MNHRKHSANTTTPAYIHPNLVSALGQVDVTHADGKPIHKVFVIGGASIYSESLALPAATSPGFVNRILLTRVLSPDFDCDVFMPNFVEEKAEDGRDMWNRATHAALEEWVGFKVPEGEQEENGVKYEFQMWVR